MSQLGRTPEQIAQHLATLQVQYAAQMIDHGGLFLPSGCTQEEKDADRSLPERDWPAHWKAQGQPWRREPVIDQQRQQFLVQQCKMKVDMFEKFYPLLDEVLTRADLEWLIAHQKEFLPSWQYLDLRRSKMENVFFKDLALECALFCEATFVGAHFIDAHLVDTHFEGAKFV